MNQPDLFPEINDELTAKVATLYSVHRQLPKKDWEFAMDLVNGFRQKKKLSEKQWYWVGRLTANALGVDDKPELPKANVGDFSAVIALFNKAKAHLKYPKICLQVGEQPIALAVAGEGSKAPGTVNVTDGRPFGQNKWFGRVSPTGQWERGRSVTDDEAQAVEQFLKKFGADPAGTAKEYGKLTGRCCFCNSELTDARSTAAGFGPTCADHYGLKEEWKAAQAVLEAA